MQVIAALGQSIDSSYALEFMKQLPCSNAIELTLMSVVPPIAPSELGPVMFANDIGDIQKARVDGVKEYLDEATDKLSDQFKSVDVITLAGDPKREIVRTAMEIEADFLLLDATGRSSIAQILFGSTWDYVATHAECSTLVARPSKGRDRDVNRPPERVLIAVGEADADVRIPHWIQRLGLTIETEVHFVHVMDVLPSQAKRLSQNASAERNQHQSSTIMHIAEVQRQFKSQGFCVNSATIEAVHVGKAIAEYAENHQCDLIVTGDQRESLFDRLISGSTSRYLLRHATSSVLIAREPASIRDFFR